MKQRIFLLGGRCFTKKATGEVFAMVDYVLPGHKPGNGQVCHQNISAFVDSSLIGKISSSGFYEASLEAQGGRNGLELRIVDLSLVQAVDLAGLAAK
jgi:hypothetical protein